MSQFSEYEKQILDIMIPFMESNKDIAKKQITALGMLGVEVFGRKWDELVESLRIAGMHRSAAQWQEVWKKFRLKNKHLMAEYLRKEARTGNVENDIVLTDYNIRISKIFGKFGTGLAIMPEAGINSLETENPLDLFDKIVENKPLNKATKALLSGISEEHKIAVIDFMVHNLAYSCGEADDETALIAETAYLDKMNSLGPSKSVSQWLNLWDTMHRHSDLITLGDSDAKEFLVLLDNYIKIPPRNTQKKAAAKVILRNQIDKILKKDQLRPVKEERDEKVAVRNSSVVASTSGLASQVKKETIEQEVDLTQSDDEDGAEYNQDLQSIVKGDAINLDVLKQIVADHFKVLCTEPDFLDEFKKKLIVDLVNSPKMKMLMTQLISKNVEAAVSDKILQKVVENPKFIAMVKTAMETEAVDDSYLLDSHRPKLTNQLQGLPGEQYKQSELSSTNKFISDRPGTSNEDTLSVTVGDLLDNYTDDSYAELQYLDVDLESKRKRLPFTNVTNIEKEAGKAEDYIVSHSTSETVQNRETDESDLENSLPRIQISNHRKSTGNLIDYTFEEVNNYPGIRTKLKAKYSKF